MSVEYKYDSRYFKFEGDEIISWSHCSGEWQFYGYLKGRTSDEFLRGN